MAKLTKRNKYLVALLITFPFLFLIGRQLGNWLVVSANPVKADLLFVLMGSVKDRTKLTMDLYKNGYSSKIVFVNPKHHSQSDTRAIENGRGVGDAEETQQILTQNLIAPGDIQIINGQATSTRDEGEELAKYLIQHPVIKNVLVVTSYYHSKRAKSILTSELKRKHIPVNLLFPFNPYTGYDPTHWWRRKTGIKWTLLESLKTVWWLGWKRWTM